MKANEAPERIWINSPQDLPCGTVDSNSVEYVRKDAFIEKACDFLKSYRQDTYDRMGYIAGIVNDKTIKDFRKYMEGE